MSTLLLLSVPPLNEFFLVGVFEKKINGRPLQPPCLDGLLYRSERKKGLSILPAFSNGLELTRSVWYTITFYLPLVVCLCSNWSLKDVHHDYLLSPPPFTLEAETDAAAEDVTEKTMAVTTVTKSAFLLAFTVYTGKKNLLMVFVFFLPRRWNVM